LINPFETLKWLRLTIRATPNLQQLTIWQ